MMKNNKPVTINGWLCGITIFNKDRSISVTKWDGAEETQIEPLKGGLSGSEKRTGSKMGIGRYLYRLKPKWAVCTIAPSLSGCPDNGHTVKKQGEPDRYINWENPPLDKWALPGIDFDEFLEPIKTAEDLTSLRLLYQDAYRQAETTGNDDNVEDAIAAKDVRKAELEKQLKDEADKNLKSVVDWMNRQIEMFSEINNEASVENVYKTTINPSLIERIEKYKLEGEPLLKQLKNAYELRIKQLKPPKRNKQQ